MEPRQALNTRETQVESQTKNVVGAQQYTPQVGI